MSTSEQKNPGDICVHLAYCVSRDEYDHNPNLVEAIALDHIREKIASFISSEKTQKVINDDYCELRLDVYVATPQEFWRIVQAEAERIVYLFKRIKAARNDQ